MRQVIKRFDNGKTAIWLIWKSWIDASHLWHGGNASQFGYAHEFAANAERDIRKAKTAKMKANAKIRKGDGTIVLDGDFNDRFERMLRESRKEKALEARKKKRSKNRRRRSFSPDST